MSRDYSLDALANAEVCFAGVSRLLYCEPHYGEVAEQVASRQFSEVPFGQEDPRVREGIAEMDAWCKKVAGPDEGALSGDSAVDASALQNSQDFREEVDALQREWLRLFVGVGSPEASCLESYYTEPNSHMFAKSTLEVRKVYRSYGLQIDRLYSEPDDHLGLMLGFLSHLIGVEIEARVSADAATAAKAATDQEKLVVGHVLPWLAAWHYSVKANATSGYFRGVGDLVFGLTISYVRRFCIKYDSEKQRFSRSAANAA